MDRGAFAAVCSVFLLAACTGTPTPASDTPTPAASVASPSPAATHLPTATTPTASATPTPAPAPSPAGTVAPGAVVWESVVQRGAGPTPRTDATLVHDPEGRRLYLFGGRSGGEGLDELWRFDLAEGSWERIEAAGPPARWGHVAVFDQRSGRLVVFSGQSASGFFDDTWTFDPKTSRWEEAKAGPKPPARYGSCSGYDPASGAMYISHGFTNSGRFDDTWRLDLESLSWNDVSAAGERPIKRCLHQCAFLSGGEGLYLFGGQSNQVPFLDDLWRYDSTARAWTQAGSATAQRPQARFFSAMAAAGQSRFLLFGGQSRGGKLDDAWSYSPQPGWLPVKATGGPPALSNHMAVWAEGEAALYVWGGSATDGEKADLWRLRLP